MPRPRRNLVLTLLPDEWDCLVEQARSAERDPYQQARWLLLRALGSPPSETGGLDASEMRPEVESAVA